MLLCALSPALACGGGSGDVSAGPLVQHDTIGDTVVVRTVSGSVWGEPRELVAEVTIGVLEGEQHYMFGNLRSLAVGPDGTIYAMDAQIPAVRVYGSDGTYRTTLGRDGGGPGEFARPDGGMTTLSDGRLVVRDPGNARLQVFSAAGEPETTWPVIRGGFNTSNPLLVGPGDTVLTPILVDSEVDVAEWQTGLQRMSSLDGSIVDTLRVPDAGFEEPRIEARMTDGDAISVSINGVPFSPEESWAYHPDGYFVHGVSTDYRFTLLRPGAPLRIERRAEPVPVQAGEKREEEAQATRNMRFTDPNWRWDGPAIPSTKPPYTRLYAARDGRIWLQVSTNGVEAEDPDYDPTDPDDVPDRWKEPIAFDVFEVDGTYLGRIRGPQGFSTYPTPLFDGDQVWAVVRDAFDVQQIVRFRIQ